MQNMPPERLPYTGIDHASDNFEALQQNTSEGSGIFLGLTPLNLEFPLRQSYVQVLFVTGTPTDSVSFSTGNGDVISLKDGEKGTTYPALIDAGLYHLVANGPQIVPLLGDLEDGSLFENALRPDVHHLNAHDRVLVSGVTAMDGAVVRNKFSQIYQGQSEHPIRNTKSIPANMPGFGHVIHTYRGDHSTHLPSFRDAPYWLPLHGESAQDALEYFWECTLNPDSRIAAVAKTINRRSEEVTIAAVSLADPHIKLL